MVNNNWINHVKAYANIHKMSYREALKDKNCKEKYKKIKEGSGFNIIKSIKSNANNINNKIKETKEKGVNIVKAITQNWGLNSVFQKNLNDYGNQNIVRMEIIRVPLSNALNNVLNLITLGKVNREKVKQNIDHLYHLKIEMILQNGVKLTYEKDGLAKLFVGGIRNDKQEAKPVIISHPIKLIDFVKNTIDLMNEYNFSHYDAVSNNCQRFIIDSLTANHLLTPDLHNFIDQEQLVNNLFNKTQHDAMKKTTDLNGSILTIGDNIT